MIIGYDVLLNIRQRGIKSPLSNIGNIAALPNRSLNVWALGRSLITHYTVAKL